MKSRDTHGFYDGERPKIQTIETALERLADENRISPLLTPGLESLTNSYTQVLSDVTPNGHAVVELGIGTGASIQPLLDMRPDIHVIGVDMSSDRLERGALRLAPYLDRLTLVQSEASAYLKTIELDSQTTIAVANTLHNLQLPEREKIINTAFSRLHRGGTFVDFDKHHAQDPEIAGKDFMQRMQHFMEVFKNEPKNLEGWMQHFSRDLVIGQSIEEYELLLVELGFHDVTRIAQSGLEVIVKATK